MENSSKRKNGVKQRPPQPSKGLLIIKIQAW